MVNCERLGYRLYSLILIRIRFEANADDFKNFALIYLPLYLQYVQN